MSHLVSRNKIIFSDKLQEKIKNTKILLVGCGLGGNILNLLVRSGYKNITIADGDIVELSNLNRQNFYVNDIGINKAKSLYDKYSDFSNEINIIKLEKFLYKKDLEELIPKHDIIVNTIDFDNPAFLYCNEISKKNSKYEIFPMNVGFGTIVSVFNGNSLSEKYEEKNMDLVKLDLIESELDKTKELKKIYTEYIKSNIKYDPQVGIASNLTSSVVVYLINNIVNNKEIRIFPNKYSFQLENI